MAKTLAAQKQVDFKKRLILAIAKCLISGGLLFWAIRSTNLTDIGQAVSSAHIHFLLAAVVTYSFSYYIRSHRWQVLLKAQKVKANVLFLFRSYMVSIFFSNFLPSTIGGDVIRGYDIWRLSGNKSIATATVFVDRFLGLLALLMFVLLDLLFSQELTANLPMLLVWVILATFTILVIASWLLKHSQSILNLLNQNQLPWLGKLQGSLERIISTFLTFGKRQTALRNAFGWSILVQIAVISHYYLIAQSLNFEVPFTTFFLIIPIATLIVMLPVSINGIGIRENTFVFLFGTYGHNIDRPEAVAFAWIAYGITILQGVVGGIIYSLRK